MKETEVAVEEQPSCFYLPCLSSIEYQEAPYQKLKQITMEVLNNSEFFCDSKQLWTTWDIKNILVSESTATLTATSNINSSLVQKYNKLVAEALDPNFLEWWMPDVDVIFHPPLSQGL